MRRLRCLPRLAPFACALRIYGTSMFHVRPRLAGSSSGIPRLLMAPPRGGIVMRRLVGVGAVDEGFIETSLDHGSLGIVRDQQMWHAIDRLEGTGVSIDPIGERLRLGRSRKSEARRAEHGDEDLRLADFPGQPVAAGSLQHVKWSIK